MATAEGVDLIAMNENRMMRVQVKASKSPQKKGRFYQFLTGRGKHRRKLTKDDCDVVCFVAVDLGVCLFRRIEDISTLTSTISRRKMTLENERNSFLECFMEA